MPTILDDVLLQGQDSDVMSAAHALLRTVTSNEELSDAMGSTRPFLQMLDGMGFGGLWQSPQDLDGNIKQECFDLTEKLIEVRLHLLHLK